MDMDLKTWFILNDGLDWTKIDIRQLAFDEYWKFTLEEVDFIKSQQKVTYEEAELVTDQRFGILPSTELPKTDLSSYSEYKDHEDIKARLRERMKILKPHSNS